VNLIPSNVDRWVGRHLFLSHPPRLLSPSVGIECVTTFDVDSDSEWLEDQQQTFLGVEAVEGQAIPFDR
jgi:hypothetical protein